MNGLVGKSFVDVQSDADAVTITVLPRSHGLGESVDRANAAALSGQEGTPSERAAALLEKFEDLSLDFEALRQRMMYSEHKEIVERAVYANVAEREVERGRPEPLQLTVEVHRGMAPVDVELALFDDMLTMNLDYVPVGTNEYQRRSRRKGLCISIGVGIYIIILLLLVLLVVVVVPVADRTGGGSTIPEL